VPRLTAIISCQAECLPIGLAIMTTYGVTSRLEAGWYEASHLLARDAGSLIIHGVPGVLVSMTMLAMPSWEPRNMEPPARQSDSVREVHSTDSKSARQVHYRQPDRAQ
jgi:hypothetical protein